MPSDNSHEGYATYRGAGFVPLFMGVPIMILLPACALSLVMSFLFLLILPCYKTAIFINVLIAVFVLWVKAECSIDSQAMIIRKVEVKNYIFYRVLRRQKILTVTSMKKGKKEDIENVQQYFKKSDFIR